MKSWNYTFKKICLLSLTAMWIGGSTVGSMVLPVQARTATSTGVGSGGSRTGTAASGGLGEERLEEDEKKIYDTLKSAVRRIAASGGTTTVEMKNFTSLGGSKDEVGERVNRAISYLIMDCPYDLYWYDKNAGCSYSWKSDTAGGRVISMTISMAVAEEYQGEESGTVEREAAQEAKKAAATAQAIVNRHRSESDYDKLKSYMTEICSLTSYNWDVYEGRAVSYGNPWQPVWVFDGDETTNVVCEGYAKAFQYLCDLSTFQDARCYTVEGSMSGGTGSGNHMWNVVTLGGNPYVVDVTNCDEGSVGAPDQLFMAGVEGSVEQGYTFSLNDGNSTVTYAYNKDQYELLGDVLNLTPYSYVEPDTLKLKITAPTAEVTFGDPVDNQALAGGKAVNGKGEEVPGSFSWAEDVDFYGNAGTSTLNAVFTPDSLPYEPVKNIRVSVKINPRPVTVIADEQSKISGQSDPELTYSYENVIEGYPLTGSLTRTSGENVGTYAILQGDLTDRNNPNYTITFTGNNLVIHPASNRPIEFVAGNAQASAANGITIKSDAAYGDLWSEIVKIGAITARTVDGSDSNSGHFTLQETGSPAVGDRQGFHVLYNGTIGGQTYRNELVCEGTVDVKRRVIRVSPGSYKVTKTYDKTRAGGTASGQLTLNNLLAADANRINVTAEPTGYTDANVSGQGTMTVNLTLNGAAAGNYELGNNRLEVPCEITPKSITPTVNLSGSYTYTGRAITPTITVADGTDVLPASDYDLILSNNRNAGTAKVTVRPKNGGNYTWSPAIETSFTIDKADYKGTKTGTTSMEYGGIAIFSLHSLVPEGYKLGDIRVEDKDKILAETPAITGTVLSCKMSSDRSKEGKTATIVLPVTESTNYHAYELTFTVTMAAQRSDTNNQKPTYTGGGSETNGTGQSPVTTPTPTTEIEDGQSPTSGVGGEETYPSADVTAVDVENSKAGRPESFNAAPVIGAAIGIVLALTIVGTYFIRQKRKGKIEEN